MIKSNKNKKNVTLNQYLRSDPNAKEPEPILKHWLTGLMVSSETKCPPATSTYWYASWNNLPVLIPSVIIFGIFYLSLVLFSFSVCVRRYATSWHCSNISVILDWFKFIFDNILRMFKTFSSIHTLPESFLRVTIEWYKFTIEIGYVLCWQLSKKLFCTSELLLSEFYIFKREVLYMTLKWCGLG